MADNDDETTEAEDRAAEAALADAVERNESNAEGRSGDGGEGDEDAEHLGDRGKRALDRMKAERKQLREQLDEVRGKLREYEDANKTEAQRLSDDRDSHKTRADTAEGELLRLRVGVRKGLTEAQTRRLVGSTEDELEDDADELLSSFAPQSSDKPERPSVPSKPTENLRGGGNPDEPPEETDPAKLAKAIGRR